MIASISRHARILGALMMREIMTRYGREGLGFFWLIGEPLIFCGGVIVMWSLLKPAYDHGVRVGSFVMTGYMCLILLRHVIAYSMGAIQANVGLLYHRQITVLHVVIARDLLEWAGATIAFFVVYVVLFLIGQVTPPHDLMLVFQGWVLMFVLSTALGTILSALAAEYDIFERIVPVVSYLLIPVSGAFTMVAWIPESYRHIFLWVPFPHAVEMVRAGVYGEFVETHFNPVYAAAWALAGNLVGILMLARAKQHVDIE